MAPLIRWILDSVSLWALWCALCSELPHTWPADYVVSFTCVQAFFPPGYESSTSGMGPFFFVRHTLQYPTHLEVSFQQMFVDGRKRGREEMKVTTGMSFVWKQLEPLCFFRMPTALLYVTNLCFLLPISLVSTWWTCPQNKETSVIESGGLTLM